jgi:hypothetical protein
MTACTNWWKNRLIMFLNIRSQFIYENNKINALKFLPSSNYVSFYLGGYDGGKDSVNCDCDCVEVRTNYQWIISVFNILIDRQIEV